MFKIVQIFYKSLESVMGVFDIFDSSFEVYSWDPFFQQSYKTENSK